MFFHNGKLIRDALDDNAFIALNISITTKIDREMVDAVFETSLVKISHPISGNSAEHLWKWDYVGLTTEFMKGGKGRKFCLPIANTKFEGLPG